MKNDTQNAGNNGYDPNSNNLIFAIPTAMVGTLMVVGCCLLSWKMFRSRITPAGVNYGSRRDRRSRWRSRTRLRSSQPVIMSRTPIFDVSSNCHPGYCDPSIYDARDQYQPSPSLVRSTMLTMPAPVTMTTTASPAALSLSPYYQYQQSITLPSSPTPSTTTQSDCVTTQHHPLYSQPPPSYDSVMRDSLPRIPASSVVSPSGTVSASSPSTSHFLPPATAPPHYSTLTLSSPSDTSW